MDDHDLDLDHGHEEELAEQGPRSKDDFYYLDNVELTTVGIDIGSSTSHLMFSFVHLQRLGQYLSSRFVVVERRVLYRSPILLTPYRPDYTIDAQRLESFIQDAYREAGLKPEEIDTGAIILTGEAVKRHNARSIASLFASEAGKFVCATAGHNLEALLAAQGSGAVTASRRQHQTVLNVDMGGGTTKFALVRDGEVLETAAINVGGRLVAMDGGGRVNRIEPAAQQVAELVGVDLRLGKTLSPRDQVRLGQALADCLLQVIRREPLSPLAKQLLVTEPLASTTPIEGIIFSGGVSEYIYGQEDRDFGDLAQPLAQAFRAQTTAKPLPAPIQPAAERIRATVIGASQFTVQVSGNTISITQPQLLPLHNIQVLYPRLPEQEEVSPWEMHEAIQKGFQRFDLEEGEQPVALAINWSGMPRYQALRSLAQGIVQGLPKTLKEGLPVILVFPNDCGKLVGEIIREDLGVRNEIISIDSIMLREFDYIDIGRMLQPANVVPVVIKSLIFPEVHDARAQLLGQ